MTERTLICNGPDALCARTGQPISQCLCDWHREYAAEWQRRHAASPQAAPSPYQLTENEAGDVLDLDTERLKYDPLLVNQRTGPVVGRQSDGLEVLDLDAERAHYDPARMKR